LRSAAGNYADAPVHDVDFEWPFAKHAIAVLELLRRDDFDVVAFVAEEIPEPFKFALSGVILRTEFDDRDIRLLGSAKLLVRFQKRLQQVLPAADLAEGIFLSKFLHRRNIPEELRERIGIARARG